MLLVDFSAVIAVLMVPAVAIVVPWTQRVSDLQFNITDPSDNTTVRALSSPFVLHFPLDHELRPSVEDC